MKIARRLSLAISRHSRESGNPLGANEVASSREVDSRFRALLSVINFVTILRCRARKAYAPLAKPETRFQPSCTFKIFTTKTPRTPSFTKEPNIVKRVFFLCQVAGSTLGIDDFDTLLPYAFLVKLGVLGVLVVNIFRFLGHRNLLRTAVRFRGMTVLWKW